MSVPQTIGLLLMAYGTPNHPDEIAPFYTHIRGGRPPTPELLAELQERYATIGGRSPLNEITRAQADGLAALLNAGATAGRRRFEPFVGMKHWHPYIGDVVPRMAAVGIRRAVGLTMTPQYSSMSVGTYIGAVEKALAQGGPDSAIQFTHVRSWHRHPRFVALLAERVQQALARLPAADRAAAPVIFTAHSLPQAIVDKGDPYPQHLRETGAAVAAHLGLPEWTVAYQSAGRTSVPWLGPDVREVMTDLAAAGHRHCVVCAAGFVADHLEVLYDLDVECAHLARKLGMQMQRTVSFNADPAFLDALAAVVTQHLAEVDASAQ